MAQDLEPERSQAFAWHAMSVVLAILVLLLALLCSWPLTKLTERLQPVRGQSAEAALLVDTSWRPGFSRVWVEDSAAFLGGGIWRHAPEWLAALWHRQIADPVARGEIPHWTILVAILVSIMTGLLVARACPYDLHRKSHGRAAWARMIDAHRFKLFGHAGLVLGKFHGRLLRQAETNSTMLIAPPGAGKSAGILIPCLLAPWLEWSPVLGSEYLGWLFDRPNLWPENGKRVRRPSWIVNDPKGELYRKTRRAMEASGYQVVKLAFADLTSDGWNPIGFDALPGGHRTVELRRTILAALADVYLEAPIALAALMGRVRDSTLWQSELANDPTLRGEAVLRPEVMVSEHHAVMEGRSPLREKLAELLEPLEELFSLQSKREQYVRRLAVMAVDEKIEPHWRDKGRAALVGGLLFTIYRCETHPDKYGEPSIGRFIDFLTEATMPGDDGPEGGDAGGDEDKDGNAEMLKAWLAEARQYGYPARVLTEFSSLVRTPGRERGSIMSTMEGGIDIFKNPTVRRTTARSDFALDDLRFGSRPVVVYLVTPLEEAVSMGRVVGMFFESAAARMISQEEGDIEGKGRPVIFAADEFWTLPSGMDSLMQIPALGRGQQVVLLLIGQSYGQIAIKINKEAVGVLKGATSNKIILQQNDFDTASEVEKAIGNRTVLDPSESHTTGGGFQKMFERNISEKWTGMPLANAQRLQSLKKMKEQIVLVQGMVEKPILCQTPAWFLDRRMSALIKGKRTPSLFAWTSSRKRRSDQLADQKSEDAFQAATAAALARAANEFAQQVGDISARAMPVPPDASPAPASGFRPASADDLAGTVLAPGTAAPAAGQTAA